MSYYDEFRVLGISCPFNNTGQKKVVCPKCKKKDKSLSINYDNGMYKCHYTKCDFQGCVKSLKKQWSRPEINNTGLGDKNLKYLKSRGIKEKTINDFKLTEDRGGIQFNYFRNEELINHKVRWETKEGKRFSQHKGAEKILYNLDSLEGKEKAIIVEGEIDVLTWSQVSKEYGIVSLDQGAGAEGSKLDGKLECFKNCAKEMSKIKQWYLCLDNDAPGQYTQKELIRRLGYTKCNLIRISKKDANSVIDQRDNPVDLDACIIELRDSLEKALPVPVPGVQPLDDEMWNLMDGYFQHGRPKGDKTHYENFGDHFSYLHGDITLVTGIPSHGKSNFIRQLMVIKSYHDSWKWACYVPEDYPVDIFYDDLVHCYCAKYPSSENISKSQYDEARLFVRDHFFCITTYAEDGKIMLPDNNFINERIEFLKLKYGVNAYVKDPWNKIHHQYISREDQYLAEALSREKFFAAHYDCAFYVAHPKGMRKDLKTGAYPMPTPYDISGGAMWYNMFDNILIVHRPQVHQDKYDKSVVINAHKIKKQKLVGKPGSVTMMYEYKKNRYYEIVNGLEQNPLEEKANRITDADLDDVPF